MHDKLIIRVNRIPKVSHPMVDEVGDTFGHLVAEIQVLQFLLLELVSLIWRMQV